MSGIILHNAAKIYPKRFYCLLDFLPRQKMVYTFSLPGYRTESSVYRYPLSQLGGVYRHEAD